jgi:hypothetical protein
MQPRGRPDATCMMMIMMMAMMMTIMTLDET